MIITDSRMKIRKNISQSETIGVFEIKGDSLFLVGKQHKFCEEGFQPEPLIIELKETMSFDSRLEIENKKMILYYISYPADAPVNAEIDYNRVD